MSEWQVIGRVAVDSGHIVITDPCNAHNAADAWDDYLKDGAEGAVPVVTIGSDNPHQAAVFAGTGFGDGYYEVKARYEDDRVAEIRIVFIGEDEEGLYAKGWQNEDGSEFRLRPPWLAAAIKSDTFWSDHFPEGRTIFYEGDDPEGFRQQVKAEFGFDVAERRGYVCTPDPALYAPKPFDTWGEWISLDDAKPEDGFMSYSFHCPPEHLDAIYGSDRFPMGS